MKTCNTKEKLPEYFYIFISDNKDSLNNQITGQSFEATHTLMTEGFRNLFLEKKKDDFLKGDIDYLPFQYSGVTTRSPSSYLFRIINKYNVEHNLEVYRRNYYKTYPSRFSCIFALGDYESCQKVEDGDLWKLESVRKFRLKDLGEYNRYVKVAKCNFGLIELLNHVDLPALSPSLQEEIYEHYWQGKGSSKINVPTVDGYQEKECGEFYEYLIEGILEEVIEP